MVNLSISDNPDSDEKLVRIARSSNQSNCTFQFTWITQRRNKYIFLDIALKATDFGGFDRTRQTHRNWTLGL